MFKRTLSIIAIIVIMLCCVPVTNAAVIPEPDVVQPMYTYTSSHNTSIYVSGSTVTCKASLAVDSGTYRVKAEYRVFSGTASETITDYSAEKSV